MRNRDRNQVGDQEQARYETGRHALKNPLNASPADGSAPKQYFVYGGYCREALDIAQQTSFASPAGLEPATLCLEGRCSIQLSYGLRFDFIKDADNQIRKLDEVWKCVVKVQFANG
jgi:hypothetical protein